MSCFLFSLRLLKNNFSELFTFPWDIPLTMNVLLSRHNSMLILWFSPAVYWRMIQRMGRRVSCTVYSFWFFFFLSSTKSLVLFALGMHSPLAFGIWKVTMVESKPHCDLVIIAFLTTSVLSGTWWVERRQQTWYLSVVPPLTQYYQNLYREHSPFFWDLPIVILTKGYLARFLMTRACF